MIDWLSGIEKEYGLDILFACEAGSRAWELSNEISDFDVRFIYRYRSLKKYLSIKKAPSLLDFQSNIDASGFDLFKAFELIAKSNPGIYEWAYSPLVYKSNSSFYQKLIKVIETSYSPDSLYKHYGSLKIRNVKEMLKGEYSYKKQKQLLQALRAELIRIGIRQTMSVRSPFEFISDAIRQHSPLSEAYSSLAAAKKGNYLLETDEAYEIVHLLESSIYTHEQEVRLPKIQPNIQELEEWIWEILEL